MGIDKELIDKLLADYKGPEDLIGEQGLLKQLSKALIERAMNAELTHHLGYEEHEAAGRLSGNSRNGISRKKLKGDFGEAEIEVPRDRNGTFTPQIVPPHQRRFTGVRREDLVAVRAGDDDARDSGTSGRDLRRGSVAVADFRSDRCGD